MTDKNRLKQSGSPNNNNKNIINKTAKCNKVQKNIIQGNITITSDR